MLLYLKQVSIGTAGVLAPVRRQDISTENCNKSALAQLVSWRQFGARTSAVPMMTKTLDAIWRHRAPMG